MINTVTRLSALFMLSASITAGAATMSAQGAQTYIISPKSGDKVTSPFTVVFGLKGMGVAPAGVDKENTGHHHLLIDADAAASDAPIAKDAQHMHFGGGQTETQLTLPPGKHTLQLLLGDHGHIPHHPALMSEKITVEVK